MKNTFKKNLALLLAAVMLCGLAAPAFAKTTQWISQSMSDIPVIRISGDGEKLVDEDGNKVIYYRDIPTVLANDDEEDGDDSATGIPITRTCRRRSASCLSAPCWIRTATRSTAPALRRIRSKRETASATTTRAGTPTAKSITPTTDTGSITTGVWIPFTRQKS